MTTCPSCGARYGDHERVCPRDGAILERETPPDTAVVGRVLDGKYRLDAFVSRGGMGAVYQATHLMLNRKVAVKLISPRLAESADTVRRFQREARAVTHLDHPNIVRVQDLGRTEDGTLYIAMDFIAGQSLSEVIKSGEPMDDRRIVHITSQIASALAHAHEHGLIHRDLKPQNIMISRRPDGREIATLLDFGIAKTFDVDANTQLTSTGFAVGSPPYMSPEQAGASPVDARSDIYSFGVILYEMLTGEVPFNESSTPALLVKHLTEPPVRPSVKRPDRGVSPALELVAMRCLEKKPEARFQTADGLRRALLASLSAAPAGTTAAVAPTKLATAAAATSAPAAASTPAGPRRWWRYVGVMALIAMIVLGARALRNRPAAASGASQPTVAEPQPPPTTAQPPVTEVEPQTAPASVPALPAEPPPQPKTPPIEPPVGDASNPAPAKGVALPETPLSRALTARVRTLLAERRIPARRFRGATLEMAMRPTRPGRGITATYAATVQTSAGERTFSGTQAGPAAVPLRNAIIQKLAAEITADLARLRQ